MRPRFARLRNCEVARHWSSWWRGGMRPTSPTPNAPRWRYDEKALAAPILAIANVNVWNRLNVATGQVAGEWAKLAEARDGWKMASLSPVERHD
jgi:hypothetical protein